MFSVQAAGENEFMPDYGESIHEDTCDSDED